LFLLEFPPCSIVREILFRPSEYKERLHGIDDGLARDRGQWHPVFLLGGAVELGKGRLVRFFDFDSIAFEDNHVVAGFQVDRYGAIVRKVTTLPRRAGRAKVQDVIDEKSPDGNRVSKRALELDRKDARFLGLEYGAGRASNDPGTNQDKVAGVLA